MDVSCGRTRGWLARVVPAAGPAVLVRTSAIATPAAQALASPPIATRRPSLCFRPGMACFPFTTIAILWPSLSKLRGPVLQGRTLHERDRVNQRVTYFSQESGALPQEPGGFSGLGTRATRRA